MAHWRTMVQSEHFCAADLWDDAKGEYRKAIFKITAVKQGTVKGEKGRKKGLPFLSLEDVSGKAQRADFGANPTNCTTIEQVLGTADAKKWIGQWIGMYVTKVDSPSGLVPAIRIHPQRVEPAAKKTGEQKSEPPASTPQGDPPAPAAELSEADKKAIELAEAEEARRAAAK